MPLKINPLKSVIYAVTAMIRVSNNFLIYSFLTRIKEKLLGKRHFGWKQVKLLFLQKNTMGLTNRTKTHKHTLRRQKQPLTPLLFSFLFLENQTIFSHCFKKHFLKESKH